MMAEFNGGTIILGLLIFAAIMAASFWYSAKRRKELLAWCQQRGLSFYPSGIDDVESRFPNCGAFRQGSGRRASNAITGVWQGRQLLAFDYQYTTGSGKNSHTHFFSALALGGDIPLKPLNIRSENVFDKIGTFFGHEDINFESAEFSRRYHVAAPDRKWAYDVLHQRAIDFLLSRDCKLNLQFDGQCVVAWRSTDHRFSPQEYESAAGIVQGLLDLLPEYVVRQQKEGCA